MKALHDRPVRAELLRIADAFPDEWEDFCVAIAQAEGWSCIHEREVCVGRMRRILNSGHRKGHAPRNFDIDWAYAACGEFPESNLPRMFPEYAAVSRARQELERGAA